MEMHINEFDTHFEKLVNYYSGLGYASTFELSPTQKSELIDAFENYRDYYKLPKIMGTQLRTVIRVEGHLLEAFHERFSAEGEFLLPDVPCRTFNENNEHLLVDNKQRCEDISDELRRMWV